MYFDRNRATLVAGPQELAELAAHVIGGESPADGLQSWRDANVMAGDSVDPTVAGLVALLERPVRSVMLEQFDGSLVTVTFVAFDRAGRATIMSGVGDDLLSVTATRFDLLPAMLTQILRLNPDPELGARAPVVTTAGVVDAVLQGNDPSAVGNQPPSPAPVGSGAEAACGPAEVLGSFRYGWRASGCWQAKQTDASITVMQAGPLGLWTVAHDAQTPGTTPTPETEVRLEPSTMADATSLLGDVVTGRAGRVRPSTSSSAHRVASPSASGQPVSSTFGAVRP
jgi:hypothetical protein